MKIALTSDEWGKWYVPSAEVPLSGYDGTPEETARIAEELRKDFFAAEEDTGDKDVNSSATCSLELKTNAVVARRTVWGWRATCPSCEWTSPPPYGTKRAARRAWREHQASQAAPLARRQV